MVFASGASSTEMRSKFAIGCFALLVAGSVPHRAAAAATPLPQEKVEQAVIDALPTWQGKKPQVIDYLDLTQPFATTSPWALVVAQDSGPPAEPDLEDRGPIAICLVKALTPLCSGTSRLYPTQWPGAPSWYSQPYHLLEARVVYAGSGRSKPLLLAATCSGHGGDGNCNIETMLYQYERSRDRFREVFANSSGGSNNNQAARFVEHGSLQGDMIVDAPTDNAPYGYWIEVFSQHRSGRYERILKYRSHTGYCDGNPLPVADSEMPEIMERLGVWKLGDPLPIPMHEPSDCGRLVMRHGEEWCRNLCLRYRRSNCSGEVRNTLRVPASPRIATMAVERIAAMSN